MDHEAEFGTLAAGMKRSASCALRTVSGTFGADSLPKHFKPSYQAQREKESEMAFKPRGAVAQRVAVKSEHDDLPEHDPLAGLAPSHIPEAKASNAFENPPIAVNNQFQPPAVPGTGR